MRLLRYEIARIYSCWRESSGLTGTHRRSAAWMPDTLRRHSGMTDWQSYPDAIGLKPQFQNLVAAHQNAADRGETSRSARFIFRRWTTRQGLTLVLALISPRRRPHDRIGPAASCLARDVDQAHGVAARSVQAIKKTIKRRFPS